VQRREHQVPGQGGIDGDVGRLLIADFTDQEDIRVLA
jgi:hypothetical protein